ncbi:MAG: TIGR02584 family CRISPR-associated protein [Kiritimatiellae bacterium]|nr:TIGR02584 family CRISPR-associated protein [Kiritimatiellia bacterium]
MALENCKTVLISVLGTSPAILTETIWALAVNERVVPDKIEIWTTTKGKATFVADVLEKGIWETFKRTLKQKKIPITGKLVLGEASWKIFANTEANHLEDLTTAEDNLAAADKMLEELRKYDEPSTEILLSIAGGRKTMGALALQCMSLLGRGGDKVYHILVNPPFDTPLNPPFFFPQKDGKVWKARNGFNRETKQTFTVTDDKAEINLFNVPYIRVRPLYEKTLKEQVVSFRALCERVQEKINRKPVLKMNLKTGEVWLDGAEIKLTAPEFFTLLCVMRGVSYKTEVLYKAVKEIKTKYRDADFKTELSLFQEAFGADENGKFTTKTSVDDLTKIKSACRQKGIPEALLPKGNKRAPDLSCVTFEIEE